MIWTFSILGVYVLRCLSCGRVTVRLGYGSALSTCYHHDDHCPAQMAERLTAADESADFDAGDRVRVAWPETDLHGRAATVRNATAIREEDGSYVLGYGITCDAPTDDGMTSFVVRARYLVPEQVSKVDELVDAWRAAADHYQRLEGRWPLVRLVMWPCAVVALVLIVAHLHGLAEWIPAQLSLCGLVVAAAYTEQLRMADVTAARAWDAIREYTGLSGDEVAQLVRDDEELLTEAPEQSPAGAVVGRYPTASGVHVTVTTTDPDAATGAPGWVATCGGCGWTGDQYACWHELWPAYPNIAGGDVRGLLLDNAQEHADTCEVTR